MIEPSSAAEQLTSEPEHTAKELDPVDIHLGQRVVALREKLGLSQLGAAKKIGVSPQQLRKYETAQNRISSIILYQIATALEQEIGFFYEGLPQVEERPATSKGNWSTLRLAENLEAIQDPDIRRTVVRLIQLTAARTI